MKLVLLTTLPNRVAVTLGNQLGDNLCILDITQLENKKESIMKVLQDYSPDVLITYRCPYVLSDDIWAILPLGAYNIHPSLLPKYKGLNPWRDIFRNHESESGVTLHRITQKIDSGTIVSQKAFIIDTSETIESARITADELAAELAKDFVSTLISNASLWAFPNKFDYLEAFISQKNLLFLKENDCIEYDDRYIEGAFCIVFQVLLNGEKYAVRCWKCLNEIDRRRICRRMKQVSDWIKNVQPLYLHEITLYEDGIKTIKGVYPVTMMKWNDDMSLRKYLSLHIQESPLLETLSDSFITMVSYFHNLRISHGDMNMDNIRVKADGSFSLIDYDTFYVPTMEDEKDEVKGKSEYQHHARNQNMYLSEYMDYYSEYIILLAIKSLARHPELWDLFGLTDEESHILNRNELSDIQSSRIYFFIREKKDKVLMQFLLFMDDMWKNKNSLNSIIPIEKSNIFLDNLYINVNSI